MARQELLASFLSPGAALSPGATPSWGSQTLADLPFRGFKTSTGGGGVGRGQTATIKKMGHGDQKSPPVPFPESLGEFLFCMNTLLPLLRGRHTWPAAKLCVQQWGGGGGWEGVSGPLQSMGVGEGGVGVGGAAAVTWACFWVKPPAHSPWAHNGVSQTELGSCRPAALATRVGLIGLFCRAASYGRVSELHWAHIRAANKRALEPAPNSMPFLPRVLISVGIAVPIAVS